jgi:hypothetical protein
VSRYRNVHCLIWNDDKFPFVSDDCQLLWFHLNTTPLTGPIGIYKATLEGLAAEKRWTLPRYKKAFAEGLAKGFWKYDERFHVIFFPKFFKHNKPENPNVLRSWIKFYAEVPNSGLKDESVQSLKDFAEGWGEPFMKTLTNLTLNLPETGTGTGTGTGEDDIGEPPLPPKKGNVTNLKEAEPEKRKYERYVFLTDDEYLKLAQKLGEKGRKAYIERLDGYISQIGVGVAAKKYKSHYDTMLNWNRKDIEEGKVLPYREEAPRQKDTGPIYTKNRDGSYYEVKSGVTITKEAYDALHVSSAPGSEIIRAIANGIG